MEGKVVVLLRTSSVARAPVYAHLRALGVILVVVHPLAPAKEFAGVFHYWLPHDTFDAAALQPVLTSFLHAHQLVADAIISFDEYGVYTASQLASAMQRRCIPLPPAALRCASVKSLFRAFCHQYQLSSPASRLLRLPRAADEAAARATCGADGEGEASVAAQLAPLRFPVVLKPSPGAGSLLVRRCDSIKEVYEQALRTSRALAAYPAACHLLAPLRSSEPVAAALVAPNGSADAVGTPASGEFELLVEEYIEGTEVDMDCVVEEGQLVFCSISDNFSPEPPFFAEVGGLCPSALPCNAQRELRDLLERFIAVHGKQLHGVLHFEAKYNTAERRAYIIEVNCRLGSAETHAMVHTAYHGLHLGEALVRCALGLSVRAQLAQHFSSHDACGVAPPADGAFSRDSLAVAEALGGAARGFYAATVAAASVNLYPMCEGTLQSVQVPQDDPHLVAFSVSAEAGDHVAPPPHAFYLLCWMVASGATPQAALKHIRVLTSTFKQVVKPVVREHIINV